MGLPSFTQDMIDVLLEKVDPYVVYLFGSYAKKHPRKDSDMDIAFLSDQSYTPYELFMLAQELSRIVDQPVDLIDLKQSTTVFQAQVVGTGKRLFCSDDTRRMYFEMYVLSMYAKLNEERQPVIDKIKESGAIYDQ